MTRVITFGCSNTFGVALPDVWNYAKKQAITDRGPSKYAWPQLLANKLNSECINLGIPGASNKQIWHTIITTTFHQTDIVIVLWSWYDRWCVLDKKQNNYEITQFHPYQKFETGEVFFKYLHTTYDMVLDFYLRCNHIETFLKDKVKIIKQGAQEHGRIRKDVEYNEEEQKAKKRLMYDSNIHVVPDWNNVSFFKSSLSDLRDVAPRACDNEHAGPKAHEKFATMIYNDIC